MNRDSSPQRETTARSADPEAEKLGALFHAISRGGDAAAQAEAELYDAYARRLLAFARSQGFTLEEAEDILQESFLKLHKAGGKLAEVEAPRAYLYQTLRNCGIDLLRRKQRVDRELAMDPAALTAVAESGSADDDQYQGLDDCLESAFTRFETDEPDRAFVIRLAVIEELDGREIAAALGRSYDAGRKFLSDSRIRFRRLATDMCGEYLPGADA